MAARQIAHTPTAFSVYFISNTQNAKGYVGFTSMTVERRFGKHRSDARKGCGWILHAAMRKYGVDAFNVELLAVVATRAEAAALETRLIRERGTRAPAGYNLTDGGDGARGYRHTEAWKAELGRRTTGRKMPADVVEAMRVRQTGKKASPEACANMALAQTGRRHSPATLEKMQQSALRRWAANPKVCTLEEAARLRTLTVGRPSTPQQRAAVSAVMTGKPKTAEHRAKLSAAKLAYYAAKRAREAAESTKKTGG